MPYKQEAWLGRATTQEGAWKKKDRRQLRVFAKTRKGMPVSTQTVISCKPRFHDPCRAISSHVTLHVSVTNTAELFIFQLSMYYSVFPTIPRA